jgi:hypothetical protein
MQHTSLHRNVSLPPVEAPIVCPVCWDHAIERVEGVHLSASNADGKNVGGASVFRCSRWHMFALFEQLITWD